MLGTEFLKDLLFLLNLCFDARPIATFFILSRTRCSAPIFSICIETSFSCFSFHFSRLAFAAHLRMGTL